MDEEEKVEKENAENFDVINEVKNVDKTEVIEEEIITDKLDLKKESGTEKAKIAEVWEDNIQVEPNFDNIIHNFLKETLIKR